MDAVNLGFFFAVSTFFLLRPQDAGVSAMCNAIASPFFCLTWCENGQLLERGHVVFLCAANVQ